MESRRLFHHRTASTSFGYSKHNSLLYSLECVRKQIQTSHISPHPSYTIVNKLQVYVVIIERFWMGNSRASFDSMEKTRTAGNFSITREEDSSVVDCCFSQCLVGREGKSSHSDCRLV